MAGESRRMTINANGQAAGCLAACALMAGGLLGSAAAGFAFGAPVGFLAAGACFALAGIALACAGAKAVRDGR